jgi:predicted SAM-dependent methyltransferase
LVSDDTLRRVPFDLRRTRVRLKRRGERDVTPPSRKLHLGSGGRKITGWLNVDVRRSDYDVDLGSGRLPWRSDSFDLVVGQHFIEHLDLHTELLPLLAELNRVIRPDGEIWLSCPDIEKICRSYVDHRMVDLIEDRQRRWPGTYALGEVPSSQMINDLFHQFGQHKNLFDFDLLAWALRSTGFANVRRVDEADLLARAGGFPERGDDRQSLYVTASVP